MPIRRRDRQSVRVIRGALHTAITRRGSVLTGSLCGHRRGSDFGGPPFVLPNGLSPDRLGLFFGAIERLVRASLLAVFRVRHVRLPSPQNGRCSSLREPFFSFRKCCSPQSMSTDYTLAAATCRAQVSRIMTSVSVPRPVRRRRFPRKGPLRASKPRFRRRKPARPAPTINSRPRQLFPRFLPMRPTPLPIQPR